MKPTIALQDLSISIAISNYNPYVMTPDFLKYSGIVPSTWKLAKQPVVNHNLAHIAFTNGINFVAQPGTITFSENLNSKTLEDIQISVIACKYTHSLPKADYQGIAINPGIFLTFPGESENAARDYITKTLLAPGAWLEMGIEPVRAAVNLSYTSDRGRFNLAVAEAKLQLPDSKAQSAVLFSGSFPYELKGNTPLQQLHQHLDNWQADWQLFREVVENQFLKGK